MDDEVEEDEGNGPTNMSKEHTLQERPSRRQSPSMAIISPSATYQVIGV